MRIETVIPRGAGFPFQIEPLENGVNDAVSALDVHEADHGSSPLTYFNEEAPNLPAALVKAIPELPAVKSRQTVAVVCSGVTCKPPVHTAGELKQFLDEEAAAG
jgi:hypothetical protein